MLRVNCMYMSLVFINVKKKLSCSFFSTRFFSRKSYLSSGMNDIHATRPVWCPAEKNGWEKN